MEFRDTSHLLIFWSCLVDIWWFFYVCLYIWSSDEWDALASWENTFHWIDFGCGAANLLVKIIYGLVIFFDDLSAECAAAQTEGSGCCGTCCNWCKQFWTCSLGKKNPIYWPYPPIEWR